MDGLLTTLGHWHWLILGAVLLILELTTGSGFLLWVGIASFFGAILVYFMPSLIWPWQLMWYSALSFAACLLWWQYLRTRTESNDQPTLNKRAEQYIGRVLTLETDVENGRGRVKVGDTIWRVVCEQELKQGNKVKVISVEGVLLHVECAQNS
jgi:inner membrane protein